MSESQYFERRHEASPEASVELLLEQGEIIEAGDLRGWRRIKTVKIKDGGSGIFKPDKRGTEKSPFGPTSDFPCSKFELLAKRIDRVLGFGLVPPTVVREVEGERGSLQRSLDLEKTTLALKQQWAEVAQEGELVKAAIFDYLINAQDRGGHNFFVEKDSGKVWFTDGDYIMFGAFGVSGYLSYVLSHVLGKGPIVLGEDVRVKVGELIKDLESVVVENQEPEFVRIVRGIISRAVVASEKKLISVEIT